MSTLKSPAEDKDWLRANGISILDFARQHDLDHTLKLGFSPFQFPSITNVEGGGKLRVVVLMQRRHYSALLSKLIIGNYLV